MTTLIPCPCCGHTGLGGACGHCHGTLRSFDGARVLHARRGLPPADVLRGARDVHDAVFGLLHARPFVGKLGLPAAANAIAFTALVLLGWLVLAPWFAGAFAATWPAFDGLRAAREHAGTGLWLATTWLVLGPPLLDAFVGALHEPLLDAAETTLLGAPRTRPDPTGFVLRLRDRARILLAALAAWPVALALVLVPWVGPPLVLLLGGAVAAIVWFEPVMAHRGLRLGARLAVLWQNRWRALGTGIGLQLAAAVPFLNLLGLCSVAAAATAASYLQFDKRPVA